MKQATWLSVPARSLRARLREALSAIRHTIQNGGSEWVADNYFLIDRAYKRAVSVSRLRTRQESERLANACCTDCNWKLTSDGVAAFLRQTAQTQSLTFRELDTLPAFLCAVSVLRIGDICVGRAAPARLPDIIGSLRELSELQANELFDAAWQPEGILQANEPQYNSFSAHTKQSYRRALASAAAKRKTDEVAFALQTAQKAADTPCTMGELLFPAGGDRQARAVWHVCFWLLWCGLSAVSLFAFGWCAPAVLLPLAQGIMPLCDRIASRMANQPPALRLELTAVPSTEKTVVAVTALLQPNTDYAERLERFYYLNPDDNLYFCLLCDLPESNRPTEDGDEALLQAAREDIARLNAAHGDRFFMLSRPRAKLESGRYGGKERKRGAVGTLIRRLCGEQTGEVYGTCPQNIRWLLTLDADTELSVGLVRDLLGVAIHPVNRARYGVFQPAVQTELSSSYRTYFTRLVSGESGESFYEHAAFDRNMTLRGEGIFCGKGLLDVQKFRARAMTLPDGKILSHDLPEGGLLGTLQISDLPLTDSVPGTPEAWYKRAHRWIRGDVQNLILLPHRGLSAVSRRQILSNLLRHLTPLSAVVGLCLGAAFVYGEMRALWFSAACFSYLLLPFLFGLVSRLCGGHPFLLRHTFTAGFSATAEALSRLGNDLCSACRTAFLTLDAMARALYRMTISHRKLLQWTTAASGENGTHGILLYLRKGLPGALVGCLLFLLGGESAYRLLGLLFFLCPVLSYLLSLPLARSGIRLPAASERDRPFLQEQARLYWNFYADTVTKATHFLPPDNLQLSPREELAMRTSPTNIGMFLLSVLAALDLGLLDGKEAADRLERTLATVEGLPKVSGNLYNWYDLQDLSVLGDGFVSFVDSGNLTVSLLTLSYGLTEYADADERFPALAAQCRRLADSTDLRVFYNAKKNLFSLGLDKNGKAEAGCYDLLISESRTASFYAVAAGIAPKKHWLALSRTVNTAKGYVGMVSWSGTMFEYLMPQLFLPVYRNSFLQETLLFALREQRKAGGGKTWGVSESGYYAFDGQLHYRYYANGVRSLALRRDARGETVISPYASFLALAVGPSVAVKNLRALATEGMSGKYGLYEAFDRTPMRSKQGVAVRSYMAHHVGMSMVAIGNALCNGAFVRRFLSDARMNAAVGLLQEKLPADPHRLTEGLRARSADPVGGMGFSRHVRGQVRAENLTPDFNHPQAVLLHKDGFSACISSLGHVQLQKGDCLLNDCRMERFSLAHTLLACFPSIGHMDGCSPLFGAGAYEFESDDTSACCIAGSKQFSGRVRFSFARHADCFCVETASESRKTRPVLFAFEPVLDTAAAYDAHQSFSKLFVESSFEQETGILFFARRDRSDGEPCVWLAVALKEAETQFSFCTSKDGFPAEGLNRPCDFDRPLDGKTGSCIDPLCVLRTEPVAGGRATLLLSMASTRKEARAAVLTARHEHEAFPSAASAETNRLLTSLLFPRGIRPDTFPAFTRELLWKHGISGDFPLLALRAGESDLQQAAAMLNGFTELTQAGIRTELLLLPEGDGHYFRPAEKKLLALCERSDCSGFLQTRGGIFLLRTDASDDPLLPLLPQICAVYRAPNRLLPVSSVPPLYSALQPLTAPLTDETALPPPKDALPHAEGYADTDGFTLSKKQPFPAPRSFVLCGRQIGCVLTGSSLGYTFCGNAHERRLTPFAGDVGSLPDGERLFLRRKSANGTQLVDLIAASAQVKFGFGTVCYEGKLDDAAYTVQCCCHPDLPLKLLRVRLSAPVGELLYCLRPTMGNGAESTPILFKQAQNGEILFRSGANESFADGVGLLYAKNASPFFSQNDVFADSDGSDFYDAVGLRTRDVNALFVLGGCSEDGIQQLCKTARGLSADDAFRAANAFADTFFPPVHLHTKSKAQNLFFERFLPYQIAASRFYARASFRQSGGAYGFRDQLQDCLALVYADPQTVRAHLLLCCAHQYEEGDVQHWWHPNGRGIRTTCSDDLLWLPYVVADYVKKTGDVSLLTEQAEYLSSPPLTNEAERYELPSRSFLSETVLLHCLRAFAHAHRCGEHGLLLMGSCDWNDAFSAVGAKGRGESVFSTFLYVVAARAFLPLLEKADPTAATHLRKTADELLQNAETHAFDGDRYLRAFCDDGTILGQKGNAECAIDILSQAFALFAGADRTRCETALKTAADALYDPAHRILKLFDPPFGAGTLQAGYIRGYPMGVRENGGQYTHAAVWGALAFFCAGLSEIALELLTAANPLLRTATRADVSLYRSEPYALCADIYSGEHAGRGGWSFYTGSAAWYYKVFLEEVLGVHLSDGFRTLSVFPRIPYELTLSYCGKLHIHAAPDLPVTLDGRTVQFPITLSEGEHTLTVPLCTASDDDALPLG